jgi:hypothetical protein
MSFNQGTLGISSNAAQTLMDVIQPLINAHPAWVFLEQVVSGSKKVDVYRCLGTLNSVGADFYVGIARGTDAGGVSVMVAEAFDGAAKTFTNSVYYSTVAQTINADGTNNNSAAKHVATGSTNPANTSGNIYGTPLVTTPVSITGIPVPSNVAPSTPWWLSVTNEAIVLCSGAMIPVYAGAYDSAYNSGTDPWPICSVWFAAFYNTGFFAPAVNLYPGGFTRDIGGSFSHTKAGQGYISGGVNRLMAYSTALVQKDPISGQWLASRVTLGSLTRPSVRRGVLKSHVISISMPEVTVGIGDTVTVDGVQYACLSTPSATSQINVTDSLWVSTAA